MSYAIACIGEFLEVLDGELGEFNYMSHAVYSFLVLQTSFAFVKHGLACPSINAV